MSGSTASRTARVCSKVKELPAGEVKGLVGHSQSMDTFGIYGHALQGEDAATSGKLAPCLRAWQPQPRSRGKGKGKHTKRPVKRTAQQVGNIKKAAPKCRRKPKVCRTRGRASRENRLQFEKLHFFFAKTAFLCFKIWEVCYRQKEKPPKPSV